MKEDKDKMHLEMEIKANCLIIKTKMKKWMNLQIINKNIISNKNNNLDKII